MIFTEKVKTPYYYGGLDQNTEYSYCDLCEIIEHQDMKIKNLEQQLENLNNDLKDNHKRVSVAEQYDISDRDFI